ncbi:MAG TPA: hypothetical protein VF813_01670 [Anaerolineaceae bacterium]
MTLRKISVGLTVFAVLNGLVWFSSARGVQAQCGIGGSAAGQAGAGTTAASDPLGRFLGISPSSVNPGGTAQPTNSGENPSANAVTGLFIAALLVGGGGYVLSNERRKARAGIPAAAAANLSDRSQLANISELSSDGREALDALLEDPDQAEELFLALIDLDLDSLKKQGPSQRKQSVQEAAASALHS